MRAYAGAPPADLKVHAADDPAIGERVGAHPLVVKASGVNGGTLFKVNVTVSQADAELIRFANAKAPFFHNMNVAILVDEGK